MDREGERRERDDSSSTSVEDWERDWEREKKEESAILMMSFSPWEEEETYAAPRGAGARFCMHMFTAFFLHTVTGLTPAVCPHFAMSTSVAICPG